MYLDLFNECVRGRWYNQTTGKVDWKIVDGLMFFRQSVESQDWIRNFLAAIPIPVYLKAWQWVPLGAWLTYRQVREIARKEVIGYVGYSQGGWPAVFASLENGLPAMVFGCPRSTSHPELYEQVSAYKNTGDVVTTLPPWAKEAGAIVNLVGEIEKPSDMPMAEWAMQHSPEIYRQRLG